MLKLSVAFRDDICGPLDRFVSNGFGFPRLGGRIDWACIRGWPVGPSDREKPEKWFLAQKCAQYDD